MGLLTPNKTKQRSQEYSGLIISKKKSGINQTIIIRSIIKDVIIKRLFLLHSPEII
jgi:large subunit ribosomal protein L19